MTVTVAGQVLPARPALSARAEQLLSLIDGGREWLDWASADPNARYHFRDEPALIVGIQSGLHVSRLLLLAEIDLAVAIEALMALGDADLRILTAAANGQGGVTVSSQVPDLLGRNRLLTLTELGQGSTLLGELGVDANTLFACQGLHDRLAVMALIPASDGKADALRQQAAAFGLAFSGTVPEFVDHYRAYLGLAATADPPWPLDAERDSAVRELRRALFPTLDCPRVVPSATAEEVSAAIEEWQMKGRGLGFARLSQALREVVLHGGWRAQDAAQSQAVVDRYFAAAQAAVARGHLELVGIGQDGSSSTFRRLSGSGEARIALAADGLITLDSFIPPTLEAATKPTSSRRKPDGQP